MRLLGPTLVLLLLGVSHGGFVAAGESADSRFALSIEGVVNTVDGCMDCGCRVRGVLGSGASQQWWLAFGVVDPAEGRPWTATGHATRCGSGALDDVLAELTPTWRTPFIAAALTTTSKGIGDSGAGVVLTIDRLQLTGFDEAGEPLFQRRSERRVLPTTASRGLVVPLLVADEALRDSFGVWEVLLRVKVEPVGSSSVQWGGLLVAADIPGARVLLDGSEVGRIEMPATVISPVEAGKREIRVRDFSNREAVRTVSVRSGRVSEVELSLLDLGARTPQPPGFVTLGKNPQGYDELWRTRDGAVVVRIPAGDFVMGSDANPAEPHEKPPHEVFVSEFLIDKTEVTWRQFLQFLESRGAHVEEIPLWGTPENYPASAVVWEEARNYCEWVGGRLPTEAEWEKAARGDDGRSYPWGDHWEHDRCNSRDGGPHRPLEIGSYPDCLSPYGLLDMAGGMWEWTNDWFDEAYYATSPRRDPQGPEDGQSKVLRGGSWISPGFWLRTSFRYRTSPDYRNVHFGFRCMHGVARP